MWGSKVSVSCTSCRGLCTSNPVRACSPRRGRAADREACAPPGPAPSCERLWRLRVRHRLAAAASLPLPRTDFFSLYSKVRPLCLPRYFFITHFTLKKWYCTFIRIVIISRGALVSRWHGSKRSPPPSFLRKYGSFWSVIWGFYDITYIEL